MRIACPINEENVPKKQQVWNLWLLIWIPRPNLLRKLCLLLCKNVPIILTDTIYMPYITLYPYTSLNNFSLGVMAKDYTRMRPIITLFRSITLLRGTNNILWIFPIFILHCGMFCKVLSVPQNTNMDLINVMTTVTHVTEFIKCVHTSN